MRRRKLWEVWREGSIWIMQSVYARVYFMSGKTARDVAARARARSKLLREASALEKVNAKLIAKAAAAVKAKNAGGAQ